MKQLTRNTDDNWLGGVCAGVADATGVDVTLVRVVLVVCTILGAGSLVVGYAVAWVLMPKRPHEAGRAVWTQATDGTATAHAPRPPSA